MSFICHSFCESCYGLNGFLRHNE
uniref:Uncharacterized protein n=1 Tax=Arundo donax TaxID=35708 RepID=A0A0A9A9X8_ARUDO